MLQQLATNGANAELSSQMGSSSPPGSPRYPAVQTHASMGSSSIAYPGPTPFTQALQDSTFDMRSDSQSLDPRGLGLAKDSAQAMSSGPASHLISGLAQESPRSDQMQSPFAQAASLPQAIPDANQHSPFGNSASWAATHHSPFGQSTRHTFQQSPPQSSDSLSRLRSDLEDIPESGNVQGMPESGCHGGISDSGQNNGVSESRHHVQRVQQGMPESEVHGVLTTPGHTEGTSEGTTRSRHQQTATEGYTAADCQQDTSNGSSRSEPHSPLPRAPNSLPGQNTIGNSAQSRAQQDHTGIALRLSAYQPANVALLLNPASQQSSFGLGPVSKPRTSGAAAKLQ